LGADVTAIEATRGTTDFTAGLAPNIAAIKTTRSISNNATYQTAAFASITAADKITHITAK